MQNKKILINGITFENATIDPLLRNVRYWQSRGCSVTFFGNCDLKKKIEQARIIDSYGYIEVRNTRRITSNLKLIFEGLRRNLIAWSFITRIKYKYDIIFTRSSVLDLVIFPYILKKFDRQIKWLTVFDNIVPFSDPGNRIIRFLAWLFFRISLVLLKKADKIFTISRELKQFLSRNGINESQIVITGNAVENNLILKAKKDSKYNIDALFIGRINETKGIYDLLNVLLIVRKKFPNFQLAIRGDGDEFTVKKFKETIQQKNLEHNIQFLSYQTRFEKFNIIKSSKCFWFLSVSECESFGIALLEAVCCGLPAFAYDLKPYKNIYKNNEVMIFKKNDFKSVAENVIELFDKGEFHNKAGELLLNKYSWDKIAEIEFNSF